MHVFRRLWFQMIHNHNQHTRFRRSTDCFFNVLFLWRRFNIKSNKRKEGKEGVLAASILVFIRYFYIFTYVLFIKNIFVSLYYWLITRIVFIIEENYLIINTSSRDFKIFIASINLYYVLAIVVLVQISFFFLFSYFCFHQLK